MPPLPADPPVPALPAASDPPLPAPPLAVPPLPLGMVASLPAQPHPKPARGQQRDSAPPPRLTGPTPATGIGIDRLVVVPSPS